MLRILTLLLLFFCGTAYSQGITLKGNVQDPDGLPLENATVYFRTVKDSTVVDYTITDAKGEWLVKSRGFNQPVQLKISFVGFEAYQKQLDSLKRDTDFGTIKLKAGSTELKEVIIESEVPPIRMKKDTLEFNAASFKVQPNANVKELLKKLPGFNIDPSTGKMTMNGKELAQILVNGKPFFDAKGDIAIENLPADIINKVQVSDFKTKKEELAGQRATGDLSSINLTIDKDKNKGFFGNITTGYGTNDRYQAGGMLNYFNGDRRVSIIGSSNNVNGMGAGGMMMGGMGMGTRGMMMGGMGIMGGGSGKTISNTLGVNYSDKWFKGFEPNLSYNYSGNESENDNKSRTETFLTDENGLATENSQITTSASKSRSVFDSQNVDGNFDIKLDSTTRMYIRPQFSRSNSKSTATYAQTTTDQDNALLNQSNSSTLNDADDSSFNNAINLNKRLRRKGRFISAEFNSRNSLKDGDNYTNSLTSFYEDPDGDGVADVNNVRRNQLQRNRTTSDRYMAGVTFTEPITDSLRIGLGAEYEWESNADNDKGFYYDATTGAFTTVADSITKYTGNTTTRINPFTEITLSKSKFNVRTSLGTNFYKFDNYGAYLGNTFALTTNYALPIASINANYSLGRGKSLTANYNYSTALPSSSQLLPVVDVTDPLVTINGNRNLDPSKTHRLSVNFHSFNFSSQSGLFIFGTANLNERQIVSVTELSTSGKRNITYRNIAGGYSTSASANYNRTVKTEGGNSFRYNVSLNGNFSHDIGYTNAQRYTAQRLTVGTGINLNYDVGELLYISPSYNYSLTNADYTNYAQAKASTFSHRARLNIINHWPKHVVMTNDISYTYNSQLSAGYRKDFFLWNASVGYNFFKEKLLFKVSVYDLLNQNLNTSRTITATGISDNQNTVLKRYFMFSLTWNIKSFAGSTPSRGRLPR